MIATIPSVRGIKDLETRRVLERVIEELYGRGGELDPKEMQAYVTKQMMVDNGFAGVNEGELYNLTEQVKPVFATDPASGFTGQFVAVSAVDNETTVYTISQGLFAGGLTTSLYVTDETQQGTFTLTVIGGKITSLPNGAFFIVKLPEQTTLKFTVSLGRIIQVT